ncbi:hypothetical protein SpAB1_17490 [Streptococcus pyogenes]|nr:hypothetical protein SpAB1_17490 [Streptococcus pyogenes]
MGDDSVEGLDVHGKKKFIGATETKFVENPESVIGVFYVRWKVLNKGR